MAAKGDLTKEEILYKWDLNGKISCDYGKSCHGAIEYFIKFGEKPKLHTKLVNEFAKKYDRKELVSEIIAYNDDLKIAATLDIVRKLGNKEVDIIDLKTNAEMTKDKIAEYELQLTTYKWLLEQKGLSQSVWYCIKVKVGKTKQQKWNIDTRHSLLTKKQITS